MNDHEFERLLGELVDDGPRNVDERVIEHALAAIPTTRQRRFRAGLLRRFTMRPYLAPALGLTAIVAATALGAFVAVGGLGPSATATPVPTPTAFCPEATGTTRPYSTSAFRVPLRLSLSNHYESAVDDNRLVLNHCEVPWAITDRPSLLLVRVPPPSTNQMVVIPLDDVRLRGSSGVIAWPGDLEAWLAAQPGVTIGGNAPPVTLKPFGSEVDTIGFDVDPSAREEGPLLFETADGEIVPLPDRPTTILVAVATAPGGEQLLILYSAATPDFGNWATSLLSTIETLAPAD